MSTSNLFNQKHCQRHNGNSFLSYHKFSNKPWSDFIFIISMKQQLQNLNQTSAFWLNLNNNNNFHKQRSAAKYWVNSSFKISPELQLYNLDLTLCSKSGQKFDFMTKLQLPNLHQTIVNTFLSISSSNNFNKFWVGIFTRQGHINLVFLFWYIYCCQSSFLNRSERVSQWQG